MTSSSSVFLGDLCGFAVNDSSKWQRLVRPVAEWWVRAVLALAPPDGGFFRDFVFHRLQTRAFVGAIAEGLMRRASAGAPPIGACFHFDSHRFPVANDWLFGHGSISNTFFAQRETETVHPDLLSEFAVFVSSVGSALGATVLAEAASVGR